jgi:hypothetical protein
MILETHSAFPSRDFARRSTKQSLQGGRNSVAEAKQSAILIRSAPEITLVLRSRYGRPPDPGVGCLLFRRIGSRMAGMKSLIPPRSSMPRASAMRALPRSCGVIGGTLILRMEQPSS